MALFQGEGDIALYNNLFVNSYGDAVHIQPHNDVPREIDVFYNTILASGAGVAVRHREGESNPERQTVQANVVFAETPIRGGEARENITRPLEAAVDYLQRPFAPLGEMSLYPRPGKLFSRLIDTRALHVFSDSDKDFNGHYRKHGLPGAYGDSGHNSSWLPGLERRWRVTEN